MAVRHDFTIEKRAKFYKEFELSLANLNAESMVGFEIRCYIKESPNTTTILHTLTEANGGVVILDDPSGKFAIQIASEDTDVDADFAWYDIVKIDSAYPDEETQRLIQGKIKYDAGIT